FTIGTCFCGDFGIFCRRAFALWATLRAFTTLRAFLSFGTLGAVGALTSFAALGAFYAFCSFTALATFGPFATLAAAFGAFSTALGALSEFAAASATRAIATTARAVVATAIAAAIAAFASRFGCRSCNRCGCRRGFAKKGADQTRQQTALGCGCRRDNRCSHGFIGNNRLRCRRRWRHELHSGFLCDGLRRLGLGDFFSFRLFRLDLEAQLAEFGDLVIAQALHIKMRRLQCGGRDDQHAHLGAGFDGADHRAFLIE